ncbi:sporulation protein YunB [Bacillus aquiflavi]|uniref:Sporulation protein YunB n=1 Tax=Bacillus aquiflavi TaxID=2672567 RepID=A0A6B3VT22_9BACI|nr:sporulation protein YunB [Bacillus aquiflavi]MBA4535994.1 sporulation protein YunB [Bacillus aquiflavi]NEY80368.1 sporulation protein YunB [Bacillus aquiflavi]UAC47716.1 sporulation protein YunB [Bacillus aquiflavi]
MVKLRNRKIRRRGPLPFRYVFLLTFVFFTFSTAFGLWIVNKSIKPTLISYAEAQTRNIATLLISKAINKKIANVIDINDIIEVAPNENEHVSTSTIKFNTEIINRVMAEITNLAQTNLKEAERGDLSSLEFLTDVEIDVEESSSSNGIIFMVPLGQATKNALLGNLGPNIQVKFNAIGDVRSDVKTKVEEKGINNTWVEVLIHIEVNVQIIVPFATKVTTVQQDIPVAMGLIQGEVPQFYNGGDKTSPSILFPGQ